MSWPHNYYQHRSITKPKVLIERHAWAKMFGWCRAADSECSGYGMVRWDGDVFRVYDVFFPKQYCSSGYTEVDDKANILLQKKLSMWGRDMTHFRLWWHTHYNFGTFWSGTDDRNAEEQVIINGDWNLSIVINQKGDYKCRVDSLRKFTTVGDKQIDKIDDMECILVPNTKKHDRKRNYKQDVKRWVRPMSEMPAIQNNKGIQRTSETSVTVPTYTPSIPDTQWQPEWQRQGRSYHDWWQEYWGPNGQEGVDEALTPKAPEKTEEKPKLERITDKQEEKGERKPMTATFGKKRYVFYEGHFIREEAWKALMHCACMDGTCVYCIDIRSQEAEYESRTVEESAQTSGSNEVID